MPKTTANPTFDPTAAFAAFALPTFDAEALVAAQRRNVAAVTAANKLAADGVKAFATRQTEIVQGAIDAYAGAVRELMTFGDPQAGAVKQAEFIKATFETSAANMRELGDIAAKTQAKTLDVLNKRVVEGLGEVQAHAAKV